MTKKFIAVLVSALTSPALLAQPAGETAITIYSSAQAGTLSPQTFKSGGEGQNVPGYALVRQSRDFNLTRGRNVIRLTDVAANIDPTTVSFESLTDPRGTHVLDQSFEFDLVNTSKLLQKYLDRDIGVVQFQANRMEDISGTLVGTQGGLVLKNADGSVRVVNGYSQVKLPELPGGLISKPTLVWNLSAEKQGTHKARYGYQTTGITWWADYNLTLSEAPEGSANACKLDVGAWVTIVNQSGAGYDNAKLKLVAGDVQRAQPPRMEYAAMAMPAPPARVAEKSGFQEKSFFEYHLYTLGRPANIRNNSMQQIELFPAASGANCEKNLVYYGQAGQYFGYYGAPMVDRSFGNTSSKKVDVYLRFKNSKDNQLGIPFPAGKVRVAKLDTADQSLEFIGEDLIDHTPKEETIQIKLGSAFDVVGERRQVDFRVDSSAKWLEEDIEVKVRNQKDEAATVIVKETLYRWTNWSITKRNQNFSKEDARTIHFPLKLAKGAEGVVRYTVRYTW
ncbi:MAG: DUF4139 domain-containing protein [Betaproteobacteria bacterium]|nr:DUF4139 domain-containing protein [Betaproteobacteria bacterium]